MIGCGRSLASAPRRTLKSIGLRPQAWVSISKSCAPGAGTDASCSFRTSGPPNCVTTIAFIKTLFAGSDTRAAVLNQAVSDFRPDDTLLERRAFQRGTEGYRL